MTTKHCPFPWTFRASGPEVIGTIYSATGEPIADVFGGECEESNARKLTTAPELAEALRACSDYFAAIDELQPDKNHGTFGQTVRDQARAVLAKLEGGEK